MELLENITKPSEQVAAPPSIDFADREGRRGSKNSKMMWTSYMEAVLSVCQPSFFGGQKPAKYLIKLMSPRKQSGAMPPAQSFSEYGIHSEKGAQSGGCSSSALRNLTLLGSDSHGLKNGTRNGKRIHTKVQFEKEICTDYFFLIFLL